MTGFGEIYQNVRFWAQMGYFDSFDAKMAKTEFFGKIRKCHCRTIIMLQLCERNQNNPMNGF